MRWNNKIKNNGWKLRFALLPTKIGDTWIWLEPYYARPDAYFTAVRLYEGCGERAGYPCDCFRHTVP